MRKVILSLLILIIMVGSVIAVVYLKNHPKNYDDFTDESYFDKVNEYALHNTSWDIALKE